MKKLLLTCLLALGLSVLLSSCEKEGSYGSTDGGYANMILGEWVLEKVEGEQYTALSIYFSYAVMVMTTDNDVKEYVYYVDERDSTIRSESGDIWKILKLTSSQLQVKVLVEYDDELKNPYTLFFKRK